MRDPTPEERLSVNNYIRFISVDTGVNFDDFFEPRYVPPNCRYCSNHPSNGGSGVCMCILGSPQATC